MVELPWFPWTALENHQITKVKSVAREKHNVLLIAGPENVRENSLVCFWSLNLSDIDVITVTVQFDEQSLLIIQ